MNNSIAWLLKLVLLDEARNRHEVANSFTLPPTPVTKSRTCDQIWQETLLGMTLCHKGLETVRGCGGETEDRQLGGVRPWQRQVNGKSCTQMVTDRHAEPTGTNYLLREPAAQSQ